MTTAVRETAIGTGMNLVQMLSSAVFAGGIGDKGTYGSSRICLLGISNYNNVGNAFVFDSTSPVCGLSIGLGIISIAAAATLLIRTISSKLKNGKRLPKEYFAFMIVASICALLLIIGSSLATDGIAKTCDEFKKNTSNISCEKIFSDGFFEKGGKVLYSKNLTTVRAAIAFGWIATITWVFYAALQYRLWRKVLRS